MTPENNPENDAVDAPQSPLLRIVNADATPEEIAAIIAVFSAIGGGGEAPATKPAPAWSANHRRLRTPHPHGAGGWRASGLPR